MMVSYGSANVSRSGSNEQSIMVMFAFDACKILSIVVGLNVLHGCNVVVETVAVF